VPSHAAAERAAVTDLLDALGPDAPTLCTGWTTRDMAAHLALRDRTPAAWPGLAVPRLASWTERIHDRFKAGHSYAECVSMVRRGAPAWSPMGAPLLHELTNLIEYVVHHEDVRRAQPAWAPRAVSGELADVVWRQLRVPAMLAFRRVPVGIMLARSGTDSVVTAKRGRPTVTIAGDPIELLLFAYNRRSAARVDLRGDETAVARLTSARLGQ
jgi:uncharacterized protein (TIGR03085 family)